MELPLGKPHPKERGGKEGDSKKNKSGTGVIWVLIRPRSPISRNVAKRNQKKKKKNTTSQPEGTINFWGKRFITR